MSRLIGYGFQPNSFKNMSEKEFNDKWSGKDPDMMDDEQLLQFKNDCFDLYEEIGFLPVFDSPYGQPPTNEFVGLSRALATSDKSPD